MLRSRIDCSTQGPLLQPPRIYPATDTRPCQHPVLSASTLRNCTHEVYPSRSPTVLNAGQRLLSFRSPLWRETVEKRKQESCACPLSDVVCSCTCSRSIRVHQSVRTFSSSFVFHPSLSHASYQRLRVPDPLIHEDISDYPHALLSASCPAPTRRPTSQADRLRDSPLSHDTSDMTGFRLQYVQVHFIRYPLAWLQMCFCVIRHQTLGICTYMASTETLTWRAAAE